jgi:uncharacterized protein with GYD domain
MPQTPADDWHREVLLEQVTNLAESDHIGGKFRELWWTIGPYDVVIVVDVPDNEKLAAFSLTLAKKFQAQTTTLLALSTEQMQGPIAVCRIKDGL